MIAQAALALAGLLAPALTYPLDAPVEVTSTVGTFRIGHHHAGLDLGTGGRQDVRVLAALPGEIIRIKRSHVGYGRSVVVRHAGGYTTVYGHLERFAPPLEAAARAEETRRKRYELELDLDPPLPVKAGDPLGWAGTSGTDLLHLHFELRRDNIPLNPLTNGLNLADNDPPRVMRLLFLPRDAGSQIEGLHAEREVEVPGETAPKPVRIAGRVGLAVEIADRIPGSARDLEPHRITLALDGRPAHEIRYDRASYAERGGTELDYLAGHKAAGRGRFHRLYREVGHTLVWPGPTIDSLADLPPGPHTARIEAADAEGNRTALDVPFEVVPFARPCDPPRTAPRRPDEDCHPEIVRHAYTESTVVLPVPNACDPGFAWQVELEDHGPLDRPFRWTRTADGPALAIDLDPTISGMLRFDDGERVRLLPFRGITPGARFRTSNWTLEVGKNALFEPYPTSDLGPWTDLAVPGLEPVGPPVSFRQTWRPARGPSRLHLPIPTAAPLDGLAIYFQENGRYWRAGGDLEPSTLTVAADLVHLGPVRLMRDAEPPVIGEATLAPHPLGPRLEIPLTDNAAGIDTDTLRLTFDGHPIHPEYLSAYGLLTWRPPAPLKPGPHALTLSVADRAGRTATRRLTLGKNPD